MGVMDRFLNAMRLNSDEDDYYDDDFYDEEEDDEEEDSYEPRRKSPFRTRRDNDSYDEEDDYDAPARTSASARTSGSQTVSKVTPMRPSRRSSTAGSSTSGSSMEVCVIKPISIDDAREITETLTTNRTVILNLEGLDLEIAQRIIDFTSGSCYAINGSLQKVSNYIFVVTPSNVDISGDIQNIMSAFGGASAIQTDI